MIGITGKRAHDAEKVMQWIRSREWGFLLLDEVHVVPANTFRKCVNGFRVHAKLGLTGKFPCMHKHEADPQLPSFERMTRLEISVISLVQSYTKQIGWI